MNATLFACPYMPKCLGSTISNNKLNNGAHLYQMIPPHKQAILPLLLVSTLSQPLSLAITPFIININISIKTTAATMMPNLAGFKIQWKIPTPLDNTIKCGIYASYVVADKGTPPTTPTLISQISWQSISQPRPTGLPFSLSNSVSLHTIFSITWTKMPHHYFWLSD